MSSVNEIVDLINGWGKGVDSEGVEFNPAFKLIAESESTRKLQKLLKIRGYRTERRYRDSDGERISISVPVRSDYRPFIKVYLTDLVAKSITKLGKNTLGLLMYIMRNLKKDSNMIFLTYRLINPDLKIHQASYIRALKELENDKWISRSEDPELSGHFVINLEMFSKGRVEEILRECDIRSKMAIKRINDDKQRDIKGDLPTSLS